jgi:hypothetical protein
VIVCVSSVTREREEPVLTIPLLMPAALVSDCMCVICNTRKTQPVLTLPLLMPVALVSDCMCVICDTRKRRASVNSTSVDACSIGK